MPMYEVEYAITRSEVYRVNAPNAKEAEELAFSDGELQDDAGETTGCETLGVRKVKL